MDIVIAYVNGQDPQWQQDYSRTMNKPVMAKRFRDWGTLKYLLRGIEENMPFIENVFLVVSRESQVPQWADRSQLKIVLHEDYISKEYLPTFNCNTIELHLHNIPGLSEKFIYFNDDVFPMSPCSEEDFFCSGMPAIGFSRHLIAVNSFKKITRNSSRMALKVLGRKPGLSFIRPQHISTPMLKSACEEAYNKASAEMKSVMTRCREDNNYNQYFFSDYLFYQKKVLNRRIKAKFFSLATASPEKITGFIKEDSRAKLICINDVNIPESQIETTRTALLSAFESKFPKKSRFEL